MKIDSICVSENHNNTIKKDKDYLDKGTSWPWSQREKGEYPNEIIGKSHTHTHKLSISILKESLQHH